LVISLKSFRQNRAMRIDHVSYATSHDSIIDVIQRIGSHLGASFIDGGIHPQFGTRNFILPLRDSRYFEIVCPLDHPAADRTPFGQLVSAKVQAGGGWLTWVVAVDDLSTIESELGRKAVEAHRKKPDGKELFWRQIGVLDTLEEASNPFFIQWTSESHPSDDQDSHVALDCLEIFGDPKVLQNRYGIDDLFLQENVAFKWIESSVETGINSVTFSTENGLIQID
jgi:hypothetical protein